MRGLKRLSVVLLLFMLVFGLSGCKSNNREILNEKMAEGGVLLSEEKFEEAALYFEELFDKNQDSITLMEKYEYSTLMMESRKYLAEAEKCMEMDMCMEAYENLKKIHPDDLGGLKAKEEIERKIHDYYLERVTELSLQKLFEEALETIQEYQTMIGSDVKMEELKSALLDEIKKMAEVVEPVVAKKIVVIDPGHQAVQNKEKEPLGPDSDIMKNKVSSGTRGVASNIYEYELNLEVSLKLRDRLVEEGFEVLMTRTTHDVSISNKERAEMANAAKADIFLRIHANGSDDPSKNGIMTIYPSKENPFVGHLSEQSYLLSKELHDEMVKETQASSIGVIAMDNMVGINWSKVPVSIIEMGYMSNGEEDLMLNTKAYQDQLVEGMVRGIKKYFKLELN